MGLIERGLINSIDLLPIFPVPTAHEVDDNKKKCPI